MLQPFSAVESPGENNTSDRPVRKHSDPYSHRAKSHYTDQKYTQADLHAHIVQQDVIMENFASPAALNPYAGTNDITHTSGFTIVIHITIWKHIFALSGSIPPRIVIGFVSAKTITQLAAITISAITQSFLM